MKLDPPGPRVITACLVLDLAQLTVKDSESDSELSRESLGRKAFLL